jgi:FlaA1/EpsC-like NDP-sugar epimerase
MSRYFMSIHEAAELIVQAGALSDSADVFLLEMGEPILIKTLAENMIRLAGRTVRDAGDPDGDIAIAIIGGRPGEKLFEELFYDRRSAMRTAHPRILRTEMTESAVSQLDGALGRLDAALNAEAETDAAGVLFGLFHQATPPAEAKPAVVPIREIGANAVARGPVRLAEDVMHARLATDDAVSTARLA